MEEEYFGGSRICSFCQAVCAGIVLKLTAWIGDEKHARCRRYVENCDHKSRNLDQHPE